MSELRTSALTTIYRSDKGYIKDLQQSIGDELLAEFISVGFIICGYTRKSKTWRISKLGKDYVEDLNLA
jgi:hypothetical protein